MHEATGVIKWFNEHKGIGFILQDDGRQDAFVHYADIEQKGFRNLKEGQKVKYKVVDTDRGPKALHVEVIEE